MTSDMLVNRNIERPTAFNFPQIMFDTEDRMLIPLPFFTHKSLRFIIDNLAILPLWKVEADGILKKGSIIDIEKLSKTLGEELSLSFGQFREAASQMFKFQTQRDKDPPGTEDSWTSFWQAHFTFFENRDDAEEFDEEWKDVELELCHERWSYGYKYNAEYYGSCYLTAKNNMIQRLKFDEEMKKFRILLESKNCFQSGSSSRSNFSKPFSEAGGRVMVTASCVLCADHSHTFHNHPSGKSKFPDGKSMWAKLNSSKICSPNGYKICIKFNIGGHRYCGPQKDRHGDSRLHICSFCGNKNHHALSWTCRNRDA